VLIVKINPADVVSVPNDCSCQKCRVSKYEIIDSYETEIKSAVCDADGNPILSEDDEETNEIIDRVESYLAKKRDIDNYGAGEDRVELVELVDIQKMLNYPSRLRVLDVLTQLGEELYQCEESGKYYVTLY